MTARFASFFGSRRAALLTALAVSLLLAWIASKRTPIDRVWADEGTFLAMAGSLVLDGDLLFEEADLARLDVDDAARSSLILERTEKGIAYSKPILLALLGAPFWALLGDSGLVALNALALILALCLTHRYLTSLAPPDDDGAQALWTTITFVFCAVVVPYVFWRMADLLQLALCLGGLTLCAASFRVPVGHQKIRSRVDRVLYHPLAPWIGAALVALTVNMRLSNGALALIPVFADALHRRWWKAGAKAFLVLAVVGAIAGLTWGLTGALDPYRAERTSFVPSTGYPAGPAAADAIERFDARPATHHVKVFGDSGQIAYSVFYFWFGRHSGLLFYFPAAVIFLWLALRYPSRIGTACLIGVAITLAFFWISKPLNYFGGGTFIGNRYFLSVYPAFLLAVTRLPSWRALTLAWGLAVLTYGSVALSVGRHHELDTSSQSHTRAGVLRILPFESTSISLDGIHTRYWAGQYVRFVDPFPRVSKLAFDLTAGRPGSELMVAHWQPIGTLRYVVECDAPEAKLVVGDWRGEREFEVGRSVSPEGGVVGIEFNTGAPWRYHGYWFAPGPFWSRAFTLRLEGPAGSTARLHHLGDPKVAAEAFAYEAEPLETASTAVAGSNQTVRLRARNTSGAEWKSDDVVAVTGRYRLWRDGQKIFESDRLAIPDQVGPGQTLDLPIAVQWPLDPGPVTLELDLVLEHVDWFQNRLGKPLAEARVELLPAAPFPHPDEEIRSTDPGPGMRQ